MKSKGRWLFWSVLAVLVLLAIWLASRPDPRWVDLVEASSGPLRVTIVEEGRTRVKDRYVVSSPVNGYLHRIDLDVGDALTAGQPLSSVDPLPVSVLDARSRAEAQARVKAAEASLESVRQEVSAAQADAELAASDYKRLLSLTESRFVSDEQLQQARAATSRAQAVVRSARFRQEVAVHELAAARTRLDISAGAAPQGEILDQVAVRSPIKGAVLGLKREHEGVVSAGDPLVEVGDPAALEVVVEVLSFDAVKLSPGMAVELTGWGGDVLDARVHRVEPVGFEEVSALGVEERRVQVIVDLASPRQLWSALGDGYRVDAEFILWHGEDQLQVPASAVFHVDNGQGVFVVSDGIARLRPVQTGPGNGLMTVIEQGLASGERVVRHPDRDLSEGDPVRAR
ncbi:efflux RND transporter periplasmic adaptor subunit [Marinobacter xestospongiae]|uniref:efflux RND transporter periplasmic adaptor subunit n=1 Tax=Marinobacter xestospongiae TaxID=994319 RepID=UPI0020050262|nr:HlyD family efflux transporter periplasmic adaptor subunit [Marinobacter xestospongiae]MCK7565899.1 HlyD family efflux transporter periplasmic adaptor subunit [Marinobacter xestospongiae]